MRVRTEINKDMYLPVQMEQKFDFLEVLSLSIDQKDFYRLASSGYGCIVGRVMVNGAVGIKNARVSVFVPKKPDEPHPDLYPFETINDRYASGKRYNLLPNQRETGKDPCYTPVGSIPTKNSLLDNPRWVEVFDTYYRYSATTNESGDFCLMGVPVGQQVVHVDVDLSDIGRFSLKPYDLIAQGMDEKLFASNTKFKSSENLDSLVNIHSLNKTVEVRPFWSQNGDAGINRYDIELPITIVPSSVISLGVFTDEKNYLTNRNCRPRRRQGRNCNLDTGTGSVEIIRRVSEGQTQMEYIPLNNFQINGDGVGVVPVSMNLGKKVTDEFGNLVDSTNGDGIPTYALIRMRVSMLSTEYGSRNRTAKYLIPNLYNDFSFGDTVSDEDLFRVEIRNVYTVANYIPRFQTKKNDRDENHIGIKRIGGCESNSPVPYNRISVNFNPIYTVLCLILTVVTQILQTISDIIDAIPGVSYSIKLNCDDNELEPKDWKECVLIKIANELGVIDKKFYNDFLVGSLYFPKFRFKVRYKRRKNALYYKYCAFDCRDTGVPSSDPDYINKCRVTYVVDDEEFDSSPSYFDTQKAIEVINPIDGRGYIHREETEFYYVGRNDVEANSGHLPLDLNSTATDKDKLLFATTFIPVGSIEQCSISGHPYFLDRLVATSHQEDDDDKYLYDTEDFSSCVVPGSISEDRIYRVCQYGVDIMSEDEDDLITGAYYQDSEETDVREYLCTHFNPFENNYSYSVVSTTTVTDQDGNDFDVVVDECSCGDDKPIKNVSPYFHYWGLKKNKSSLDLLRSNYVSNCQ